MLNRLLAKAEKKAKASADAAEETENANMQGGHTDHHMSAYQRRMQMEPMHGDELEQFNRSLDKLEKKYKSERMSDLIEYGIDDGMFSVDGKGMLRVSMELPE